MSTTAAIPSTPPEWAVFCVYGPQHVAALRGLLLPALVAEKGLEGSAPVFVVNYLDNTPLLTDASLPADIWDLSASRRPGHIGFGEAVNFLFSIVQPRQGFFLINPDCYPLPGSLAILQRAFECTKRPGIIEAHQWPREHPKEYNPKDGSTPWSSCACCLVSSAAFASVAGFDPIYFLYNEDVDLSWRMRLAGFNLVYVHEAIAAHFTGLYRYREDRFYLEHFYSSRNFLVLNYKFFGLAGEQQAIALLRSTHYPAAFQSFVLNAYLEIKPDIRRHAEVVDPKQFKVTGFNLYHELRYV